MTANEPAFDFTHEREFIGYGMNSPDPQWPKGAKIAVSFVVNYYMGAEFSPEYGDPGSEWLFLDLPRVRPKEGGPRSDINESMYEYGGREGVPRILNLFKKYGLKYTWNISTQALEKAPYWARHIVASGAELSCASKRYIDYMNVDVDSEATHIAEAVDSLQKLSGDATLPHGWMVDRRSNVSIRLYAREHAKRGLPLLYSSDSCSDDLPYWTPSPLVADGQPDTGLLMLPFSYDTSDFRFNAYGNGWSSPKDYAEYLRDTFDVFYDEGLAGEAKMMTVVLHPHIIGRGGRLAYFEEFLQYVLSKPGVWIARRDEIAAHWAKQFPYHPTSAFCQTKQEPC
ncbi:hypothetical protein ACEPAF_371 [Sanghuangporus sanghuang]